MEESLRVLLIDCDKTTADVLRDRFGQIQTHYYDLDWVSTREAALDAILGIPYDVYLFDLQFVSGEDRQLLQAILELGRFAPAIALCDTPEAGRMALEWGAVDYLDKDRMSLSEVERSLRLSRKCARLERQLAHFNRDRQFVEETLQENESAFQRSEERLHGILESLDDVVWSFDPRIDKLLYLNSVVESVYGYTISDFFEDLSLWRSRVRPEDRAAVRAADLVLPETGSFDIDYRIIHRDGTIRWLRERTRLIYDSSGTAIRRNSIASDISDRKAAEEQLRHSEERFRSIFDNAGIGIAVVGVDGKLGQTNPFLQKLLGYSSEELAQFDYTDITDPTDLPREQKLVWECEAGLRDGYRLEKRYIRKDGKAIWIHLTVSMIRDSTGQFQFAVGMVEDITQRKQAEEQLQQQMERERLLAQIARDIRSSLDLDKILNTTVRQVRQLLQADRALIFRMTSPRSGFSSHESIAAGVSPMLGTHFEDDELPATTPYRDFSQGKAQIIYDLEVDEMTSSLRQYLRELGVKSKLVVPILQQDALWGLLIVHQCGRKRNWQGWEVELLQQLATQVAIALYQAQLLEEQTRYARELARSNQELEQFAYITSHDLQEPLRAVISFAELLQQEYQDRLDAEAKEYIDFIVDGATRMRQLIQDLLAFSRVGTRGKAFAPTDCERVLQQVLRNLSIALSESDAVVTHDPLPTVMADESQLIQLLQNLISNAIKFHSNQPPRVHLSAVLNPAELDNPDSKGKALGASVEDPSSHVIDPMFCPYPPIQNPKSREWLFSVRDNGIGIDAQYRDRIFAIFQRLHTRRQYEGTGIGLAICQKIVQRHGGRIWVESTFGRGSVFYFTILEETR